MDLPKRFPVEYVKDAIPNFISVRRHIAEAQRKEIIAADQEHRTPRRIYGCQYCGEAFPGLQNVRGHLVHCRGRAQVREAITRGISFRAGSSTFIVRTKNIKHLVHLARLEKTLAESPRHPQIDAQCFYDNIRGAQSASAEGSITFDEIPDPAPPQAAAGAG